MNGREQTSPVNAERWKVLQDLFYRACDLPVGERNAFITEACGSDVELRAELESLVASADLTLGKLRRPVEDAAQQVAAKAAPDQRIGPYRLIRLLGAGGMGEVFLAARADLQYEQQVAIKLMQPGAATGEAALERFRAERQILANLDYPNIAKLLDGGVTESGAPYLVMEYVDGLPINVYCAEHKLSTYQRLKLFRDVCMAVDYAHRNLVIHRDIKPANILVTAAAVAKLLDFGVAKLHDPASADDEPTKLTQRLMTPDYASPEQVRGEPVNTATDIYSLGALLYELLTERRPFRLPTGPPLAIARIICEQHPVLPSRALTANENSKPLKNRSIGPDLDAIVMKAMSKDPSERYESAAALARDVVNYQRDFPVSARGGSWAYTGSKFIRRHWLATALGIVAALSLIILSAGFALMARRANQQRDLAEREAHFLVDMFRAATPEVDRGKTITARDLLDQSATRVDRELAANPSLRAPLLQSIAEAYQSLGLFPQAIRLASRAYELKRQTLGTFHASTADSLFLYANLIRQEGDYRKAEPLFREAADIRKRAVGSKTPSYAAALAGLGECLYLEGKDTEAEAVLNHALDIDRRAGPDFGSDVRNYLALLLEREGNYTQAVTLLGEAVEIDRRTQGTDSPDYATSLHNLASALIDIGDLNGAEAKLRETLAIRRRVLGEGHAVLTYTLNNLGYVLLEKGTWQAAEPFLREALEVNRKRLGENHPRVAGSLNNWARLLQAKGDYTEAEQTFRQALDIFRHGHAFISWPAAQVEANLGLLEFDRRNYAAAETWARQALEMGKKLTTEETPAMASSLLELGEDQLYQGDPTAARTPLEQALEIRKRKLPDKHPLLIEAEVRLGEDLAALKLPKEAEAVLRIAVNSAKTAPFPLLSWQVAEAESALAASLRSQHQDREAEALERHCSSNLAGDPRPLFRTPAQVRLAALTRSR